MLLQVLLLAVNGNKKLRFNNSEHKLEFLAAGMAGNVNVIHLFVNNFRAELHQLVNDTADGLFVAGNGGCGNNNVIVRADGNLPVVGKRHSCQRGHRLALTARCDKHKLVCAVLIDKVKVNKHTVRHTQVAELTAYCNNIFKAAAGKRNLSAETFRNINYLLNTVDIRGKGGNDYPSVAGFSEKHFKRLSNLVFALGKARTFGIC